MPFVIIQTIGLGIATVLALAGGALISGSGTCLGKTYGKTNYLKVVLRGLCYALSLSIAVFILFMWARETLGNFFDFSLLSTLLFAVEFGIFVYCFGFKGVKLHAKAEDKLIEKYADDIRTILMDNPVFSAIFNELSSNHYWKTVRIYRDGVAFYEFACPIPKKLETEFTSGASSDSEAEKLLKAEADSWLNKMGTVSSSNGQLIIKYCDYGFENSESAMTDIAKHLERLLKPRFKLYESKHVWSYDQTTHYTSDTYIVRNGVATPASSSTKHISACVSVIDAYALIEPDESEAVPPPPMKKW
jgi:hypothetical protein